MVLKRKKFPADYEKARNLKRKRDQYKKLRAELPHRYGFKWYLWAWNFYKSMNKMCLLVAANQVSKSSTLIRRHIERATNKALWPVLWPDINGVPNVPRQFWYLYPTKEFATSEFQTKWVPEFMPKKGNVCTIPGKESCDDPVYGWKANYEGKFVKSISWKSGIVTYMKSYAQDVHALQGSSVHEIDCDEELPEDLFDELKARIRATRGYFAMVFTATRNQLLWHMAMEGRGSRERFPNAFKQQISLYECRFYKDGTPGRFNDEDEIEEIKKECRNDAEIERRVNGRFVASEGRKYPTFDPLRHFVKPFKIPKGWLYYGGVDVGSGGQTGHPSAIGIWAVSPDYKKGYIIDGWRGEGEDTSSGDVVMKFIEIRGDRPLTWQCVDPKAKDFITIAERMGEPFIKAENSHEIGESLVNTLLNNDMMGIFDLPQLQNLGAELLTLMNDTPKNKAKDDFVDGALRYPSVLIPWDWTAIKKEKRKSKPKDGKKKPPTEEELMAIEIRARRGDFDTVKTEEKTWEELTQEISYWNDQYG